MSKEWNFQRNYDISDYGPFIDEMKLLDSFEALVTEPPLPPIYIYIYLYYWNGMSSIVFNSNNSIVNMGFGELALNAESLLLYANWYYLINSPLFKSEFTNSLITINGGPINNGEYILSDIIKGLEFGNDSFLDTNN